jgi:hypothetical protein
LYLGPIENETEDILVALEMSTKSRRKEIFRRIQVEVKRQRMKVKVRPRREEISRMMDFEVRVKFKEVESKNT